ncbi:MAG TPA: translocation/assembly module TamB domain-containing protein, partial [Woeseiaceae bacterium]|nr:translocation/assembly module TamB domain-containing protein [Woeseiaceae bacterium]
SAPQVAEGRFRMAGDGNLDGITLRIADSAVLGGKVTGDLAVGWREHGAWSASLSAEDVRIRPFLPDWPGRISTDFRASGEREPFRLSLDIATLDGELRGRPVSAAGRIAVAGGDLRIDKLLIASGESRVELDGAYRDADGLTFDATLASLGDLLPGAAGRLRASGNAAAIAGVPRLALQLDAADVRWQDLHAAAIKLANDPAAGRPFDLSFEASKVVVSGNALDTVSAALVGTPEKHRFELAAALAASRARLALEGGVDRVDTLAGANWEGQLAELELTSGDTLSMTLVRPAAMRLSARATSLNRSCLVADDGSTVCLSASRSGSGAYASVIEMDALPLNLVHLFVDNELEFSQTLDGTVQVSKPPQGAVSAGGRIDISPGEIRNTLDARLTLKTRTGFARFALDSGSLLSGELSLPFSDTAELAGQFRVMDIAQGSGSAVDGFVRANISDIGVAAGIVPMIDEAGGRFEANIRIDGTLDAPHFAGAAGLSDGLLVYDPLGMRVEDIQLDAEIRAGNRIEVQSTFRAGEGHGRITTSADYLQGRQAGLELAFSGNNLALVDVPTLQVHANADLTLGLHKNDVTIDGKVVLPRARLSSVNITSTSVAESADVEVIGNGTTAANGQSKEKSALDYHGSIELELGDDVVIDVDLAQARLRGASTFAWDGPAMPLASGAYDVSGKFQAYGQLLEITEGIIRYPRVPANQPELRIRAEREIFGNSEVRRAGVLVTGTATRPTLEVYTTPATTGDRALTLLVTGSDFDYEQGVGAVDVGTYIAPRLYASYGVGLFDKENVISVRYDLAKGFGIKATSGKRADGVDISYTIEH